MATYTINNLNMAEMEPIYVDKDNSVAIMMAQQVILNNQESESIEVTASVSGEKEFVLEAIRSKDIHINILLVRTNTLHINIIEPDVVINNKNRTVNEDIIKLDKALLDLAKTICGQANSDNFCLSDFFDNHNPKQPVSLVKLLNEELSTQNEFFDKVLNDLKQEHILFLICPNLSNTELIINSLGSHNISSNTYRHINLSFNNDLFIYFNNFKGTQEFENRKLLAFAASLCHTLLDSLSDIKKRRKVKKEANMLQTAHDKQSNASFFHVIYLYFSDGNGLEDGIYFQKLFTLFEDILHNAYKKLEINLLFPLTDLIDSMYRIDHNDGSNNLLINVFNKFLKWKNDSNSASINMLIICNYYPAKPMTDRINKACIRHLPPLTELQIASILEKKHSTLTTLAPEIFQYTGGAHKFMEILLQEMDDQDHIDINIAKKNISDHLKPNNTISRSLPQQYIQSLTISIKNSLTIENELISLPTPMKENWELGINTTNRWCLAFDSWLASGLLKASSVETDCPYVIFENYPMVKLNQMGELSVLFSKSLGATQA